MGRGLFYCPVFPIMLIIVEQTRMDMRTMINVSIVNVTSYTGIELLRLLSQHPQFVLKSVTARSAEGKQLDEVFPQLCARGHLADMVQTGVDPELVITG